MKRSVQESQWRRVGILAAWLIMALTLAISGPGARALFYRWTGVGHSRAADVQRDKSTSSVGSVSLSTSSIPVNTQCDAYVSVGPTSPVPEGGTFTITSSNPAIASVPAAPNNTVTLLTDSQTTSTIKVTGVAHGQTTITATSQYGTVTAATINVN